MKSLSISRPDVLKLTWELIRKTAGPPGGLKFGQALRQAWKVIRLKTNMLTGPQSFFFKKENGEERFAVGFYGAAPDSDLTPKPDQKQNLMVVKYFDTLVCPSGAWRSFRADRLLAY